MNDRASHEGLALSPAELVEITRYRRAGDQLEELHRRGFHRAELGRDGKVLLERAHYEAVCAGVVQRERPRVKPPVIKDRRTIGPGIDRGSYHAQRSR